MVISIAYRLQLAMMTLVFFFSAGSANLSIVRDMMLVVAVGKYDSWVTVHQDEVLPSYRNYCHVVELCLPFNTCAGRLTSVRQQMTSKLLGPAPEILERYE